MRNQFQHGILPDATHDEYSRENFVHSLKTHVMGTIGPGNRKVYDADAEPKFLRAHNRPPENRHEVGSVMRDEPYWQMYSSVHRSAQEMMWETCGQRTERQIGGLIGKSKALKSNRKKKGSLRLDPNLKVPRYNGAVDIHIQPGGYHSDLAEEDVFAGALYDTAVYIYVLEGLGPKNDDLGRTAIAYLKKHYPNFKARKILDMGCAVGHSTLPYLEAFPGAEVHALDVGAPMLRYAHARAESLGAPVHFSQQNAEHTDYPDASFDLIASHILFHETSAKAIPAIIKECHRLLKPGGMMIHAEVPAFEKFLPDPYDQFHRDWATHYNAEPFWGKLHEMDMTDVSVDAGFAKEKIFEVHAPATVGGGHTGAVWYLLGATK